MGGRDGGAVPQRAGPVRDPHEVILVFGQDAE
jgi:hypothetical protein